MFSPQENAVFTVVNSFGESFDTTTLPAVTSLRAATPLPTGEGLGVGLVGLAGLVGLCCHLPPCCHHRYISEAQRVRKVGGRVAAKTGKNFFI